MRAHLVRMALLVAISWENSNVLVGQVRLSPTHILSDVLTVG